MKKNPLVMPVLKWVGGKRQLLKEISKYIPTCSTYYEPFLGGGAVLFKVQPKKAVINDLNGELINVYEVIQNQIEELITELNQKGKYENTAECFYQIRQLDRNIEEYQNLTQVQRAARVIYLNKTCYNGLYRVNRLGEFNTPFGRYENPSIINEKRLRAVHEYFNKAKITFLNGDFEAAVKGVRKGSFVYFDPPYEPISVTSNFNGYHENQFAQKEQIRLKKLCDKLDKRGVNFLVSNSDCKFIRDLYEGYEIIPIKAKRYINSNPDMRGPIGEVLIRNHVNKQ